VTETNAQESAKSPALATNAALASAGSYGLSAVVGIALLAALVGGVVGALAFKDGGYVQGPGTGTSDSILARLSNGEYVMPAESVNRIGLPALEAMKNGEAANVPSVGGATSVAIFDDRAKASQWLKTKGGRKALMDTVGKHQHEFRG
jgi:hypothetical protein